MERVRHIQKLLLRSERLPWLVTGLTLVILAGAIFVSTHQQRSRIRGQIAGRDGAVLHAVAQGLQAEEADTLIGDFSDPVNQLTIVLKTSRLTRALATRLFDAQGRFVDSFPPDVRDENLSAGDLIALRNLKPVSHFRPATPLSAIFLTEPEDENPARPLLEVNVPLHTTIGLAGIAQFIIEGQSIAEEYAQLDRHLLLQASGVFVAGAIVLVVVIGWASRRLRQAHRELKERTDDLLQANQELAMAAKTSAVGAVTAHLIHGLRNPLSGLQHFVSSRGAAEADQLATDWAQAASSTRRMQGMISQIVSVLREEESASQYEIALPELGEIVSARVQSLAREAGVPFLMRLPADATLPNRPANLVALILVNLAQNAVQATPRGKSVSLTASSRDEDIVFAVRDEGPGIRDELMKSLFSPCQSTKEGGSGIGLAISKQLANHLGAELELKSTGPAGCVFTLTVPAALGAKVMNGEGASAPRRRVGRTAIPLKHLS